jgi:hypothetical protein
MLPGDIYEILTDILRITEVVGKMKNTVFILTVFFECLFIWFHKYVIALYCSCDENKLQLLKCKLHFNMMCSSF